MMKSLIAFGLCLVGWGAMAAPTATDPFRPDAVWQAGTLSVTFTMATPDQHLYDDMLACSLGEPTAKPSNAAQDGDGRTIYEGTATFCWSTPAGKTFTLDYQGCDAQQCYMPQSLTLTIAADGTVFEGAGCEPPTPEAATPPRTTPPSAPTMRRVAGFVPAEGFVAFLRGDESVTAAEPSAALWDASQGIGLLLLVVFLGGLALNLTPCVLPMMPINLAIIGAGAAGGSRLRGALRGGAYGLGIALAYGVLALIPVLTGAAFGALQAAWWFNGAIAVIFVLLALALLDLFAIDLTRFSGPGSGKQGAIAAFVAGAVSAVLAGACVAPVLIAVLLLTADGIAAGAWWMLCLPFVLGLGMAAPWPIAGAGLAFLPKPGAWMVWVKRVFALIVLGFAVHYGWTAVRALLPSEGLNAADLPALEAAIAEARAEGKPVLLDFWGPACKACEQMEREVFPDEAVRQELQRYAFLKVRMDLADPAIRPAQERFAVQGLPTYLILE